jgi:predicted Zn-dependent protease
MEELQEIVDAMLVFASKIPEVEEAEAYASKNLMTLTRIETLRHRKNVVGPWSQQLITVSNCEASIRVVINKAVGTFSTNYFSKTDIKRAVEGAIKNARIMSPDPNFESLARPITRAAPSIPIDKRIAEGDVGPSLLDQVEAAASQVDEPDLDLAGSLMAVSEKVSLANTHGVELARTMDTFAVAALTAERVEGPNVISSGVGWSSSRNIRDLSGVLAAQDALEWGRLKPERKSVPPGDYDVILGPYAVADVLDNMVGNQLTLDRIYFGLSWIPSREKKTDAGRVLREPVMGEQLASELVTISDDPTIKNAMASKSYDDEGLPTTRKTLIERGRLTNVLGNTYYSYLYDREPSGSGYRFGLRPGRLASCQPNTNPTNLVMEPGDMTYDELVEEARKPTLVIPRTWYTYPTRFGGSGFSSSNRATSYLIDKGKITSLSPNAFKLTADVSTFLKEVSAVGKDVKVATTWAASSAYIVPYVKSTGFRVEKASGK